MPFLPKRPSLLLRLTAPVVAAVVALAAVVGVLSYRAGCRLVEEHVQQLLAATVQRVGEDLAAQRSKVDAVLGLAAAEPLPLLDESGTALGPLAQRLWSGVVLHPDAQGGVRLGTRSGQAITVQRLIAGEAELGWQAQAGAVTLVHRLRHGVWVPGATLPSATVDPPAPTDVRQTDWFRVGDDATTPRWTSVELDPRGPSLVRSRVRSLQDASGRNVGVAATTLDLQPLAQRLQDLPLPPGTVAFIVEQDGQLVAMRDRAALRRTADGRTQRVALNDAGVPLAWAVYQQLLPQLGGSSSERPSSELIELPDTGPVLASFGRHAEGSHEGWSIVVAVPRRTLMAPLAMTAVHTVAAALVAVALMLVVAAWLQRSLLRDVHELVGTAQRIGDGDLDTPPGAVGSCELDQLRDGLRRLQHRLRSDRGTGLANREAVLNRLHDRMRPGRRHNDAPLIALLFVDLDRFHAVNDRHGRDAGDIVLQTVGLRLRQTVRDTDLVARWGADEFVLLLDGVDSAENAERVREQVERVLRDPVELGAGRDAAELEGTVGLALAPADEQEPEVLLRGAEADMHQRKPVNPAAR